MIPIPIEQATPIDLSLTAAVNGYPDVAEDILRAQQAHGDPRVLFNLGYHEWRHGKLAEGLALMDAGRAIRCFGGRPVPGYPTADALDTLSGKTLLLRLEGGLGDEIFGARWAAPLAKRGARVVLSCHRSLMSILSRVEGVSAVVANEVADAGLIYCDAWVPGMSAGRLLDLRPDNLPPRLRLRALPAYREKWAGTIKGDFKVGLRWRGNPQFEHEQFRTFPPEALFGIADIDDVSCYSLQRDAGAEMLPKSSKVVDLGPHLASWEDTAAVISHLDLVVTSCTAIAHLAGAMGVPTWVVVPVLPYYIWAWPWGAETSPWYNRVRLFRQEKFGSWESVLSRVVAEVRLLAEEVLSGGDPVPPVPERRDFATVGRIFP